MIIGSSCSVHFSNNLLEKLNGSCVQFLARSTKKVMGTGKVLTENVHCAISASLNISSPEYSSCRTYMLPFLLYADDTCLVCQHKVINNLKNKLNEDFCNICDWFVDSKLSIHFGEDKIKSIFFASKFKRKNIKKLHIKYEDIQIIQHSKVKYLGCLLDKTMSGEAMALKDLYEINNKLKFLYLKNSFLAPVVRRLLCNVAPFGL